MGGDVDHPVSGGKAFPDGGQQGGPVVGAGDHVRLGEGLRRIGESLGEAAGQSHLGRGVLPLEPPQDLAGLFVPAGGDGAGVDHIDIGDVGGLHQVKAGGGKLLAEDLGLVLVDLAAQGIKSNAHMFSPIRRTGRRVQTGRQPGFRVFSPLVPGIIGEAAEQQTVPKAETARSYL